MAQSTDINFHPMADSSIPTTNRAGICLSWTTMAVLPGAFDTARMNITFHFQN